MTTDAQLEAMCAQHVAGWRDCHTTAGVACGLHPDDKRGEHMPCPRYCSDPAAVIELLEKEGVYIDTQYDHRKWSVCIWLPDTLCRGTAPTLAKAGVLALLRARGVEVEG
jgi:hypothetical protein